MAKLGRRLASEGLDAVCKFHGAPPYPAFSRPRLIGAVRRSTILGTDPAWRRGWEPGESRFSGGFRGNQGSYP